MRFRVLTYNIHRAIGLDRRFRPERIAEVVAAHDADVVLLQEVDEGVPRSARSDLGRELAAALDYPHFAIGHNVTLREGRYGNATLSRHRILAQRNIDLSVGVWRRRGCLHTALALDARGRRRRLDVFNLHLGLSGWERERQVALLARARELARPAAGAACLVAGDFNDWRSRLVPALQAQLGLSSATDRGSRSLATYPSFLPGGPLDRIYYRGPLKLVAARRCRLRLSRVASDHLPVIADFELE